MKVKVTKSSSTYHWYANKIGNVFEVVQSADYHNHWSVIGNPFWVLDKDDCEVLSEITLERVNFVLEEQSVEALETCVQRMQAHIEERKKPKPFTQKDFDDVLSKLRASPGRTKFIDNNDNWSIVVADCNVFPESWTTWHISMFGVWFSSRNYVDNAIASIGADNIIKAVEFYESIGL